MAEFFTVTFRDGFESEQGNIRQLSEEQAQAIVEMTLGKLTGLEREKIEEELARLHALIIELEGILADPAKIMGIIKDEMNEIKRKFSDERLHNVVVAVERGKHESRFALLAGFLQISFCCQQHLHHRQVAVGGGSHERSYPIRVVYIQQGGCALQHGLGFGQLAIRRSPD
jgi:wyosine [tRNA(Phe)-imidazoG37] synthetase (radical SAM superfamily)